MTDVDKEIQDLRQRLNKLQEQKRKAKAPKKKKRARRGRPRISAARIKMAHDLAKEFPIADVSNKMEISVKTLGRYGIKRYRLNAEAEREAALVK